MKYRTPSPTPADKLAIINSMFKSVEDPLTNLYVRWQNEKQYEDFADYEKAVKELIPPGITMTKMCKSPFGFKFKVEGFDADYQIKVSYRVYEWKRIA